MEEREPGIAAEIVKDLAQLAASTPKPTPKE
jgi:hypothetical protein